MFRFLNGDLADLLQMRLYRRPQVPDGDVASTFRRPVEWNWMASSSPYQSPHEISRSSHILILFAGLLQNFDVPIKKWTDIPLDANQL